MKRNLLRLSCLTLALLLLTGCGGGAAAPKSLTADLKSQSPDLQPITEDQAGALTAFSWTSCGRAGPAGTSCSLPSPSSPPWA